MIFKKEFEIGMQDINRNKMIKNKYILNALEDVALRHSDSVGLGLNDILETGLTWMLLDWKVEILKRPKYGDKLEVHTWGRNMSRCYAHRDFEIYVNNERYVIATSKWLLFDINRKRPAKVTDELVEKYEPEDNKSVFSKVEIDKMCEAEVYDNEYQYNVRKSDIDINGHIHNLNYLDIAYECFDENDYNNELNNIRITYKKEIKFGDNVKCKYTKKDDKWSFIITNEETNTINSYIELY